MNVSWSPIPLSRAKGFVERFNILYITVDREKRRQSNFLVTVSAEESYVVIGGLDPTKLYNISVSAQNQGDETGLLGQGGVTSGQCFIMIMTLN